MGDTSAEGSLHEAVFCGQPRGLWLSQSRLSQGYLKSCKRLPCILLTGNPLDRQELLSVGKHSLPRNDFILNSTPGPVQPMAWAF